MASPFNLQLGDSVYAKVSASNLVGPSEESSIGNGAIVVSTPSAPLSFANNAA
jgi:hypothetical protein